MIRTLTGSVLLLLSVASAAGGFYGEINVGQAKQKSEVSTVGSFSGPEITLGFQLGYQFLPYLAIEGGYNDFGEVFKRNFVGRAAIDSSALNAGLKAILPLGELFSLYARGGVAFWDYQVSVDSPLLTASASDKGRDFYYGAGARFNLKEFMYVGLEYTRLDMALDKSGVDAEHRVDNVALTLGVFF